jgi:hypothetical protein
LKLWRKKATTKPAKGTRPAEIDELRVACTVLAARTVGLTRNGQPILAAGEPATFGSDAFLRALGQDRPIEAVRAVFGLDGHVLGAASYIVDEAGYGEQGDPGDTVADELGYDPRVARLLGLTGPEDSPIPRIIRSAARVAYTFKLDPLVVLGGVAGARRAELAHPGAAWSVRGACHEVIMADMREQARRRPTTPGPRQ